MFLFAHVQIAQIHNATGTPFLNQIIVTGGSYVRGIGSDQDSNVWVTNLDSTVDTIPNVNSAVSSASRVQGLSMITGLANAYGFGGEHPPTSNFSSY